MQTTHMIYFTLGVFLVMCCYNDNVIAYDPDPLQDFYVASNQSSARDAVTENDFLFAGLGKAGNTTNAMGSTVMSVNVMQIPGLNMLGISMVRIDFVVNGLNPPHTHPRATEIAIVIRGTVFVGFVDTNNKLFSKTLEVGDVFMFPKALVHFQQNVGNTTALVISGLRSQLSGVQVIANSLFGANPSIPDSVLSKAFQISGQE